MNPRISIIIPVLNEATRIAGLLKQLERNGAIEVIVVDGGSSDGSRGLVSGFNWVKFISSPPGRGIQLNRGAEKSQGEILWFLHADSDLPEGWESAILKTLSESGVVAGSFQLRFDTDHPVLRFFASCSRFNRPLFTFGDQGYFMPRSVFFHLGGFQNYPFLEDVEIQCRIRKLGVWKKSKLAITTSARRFVEAGILRQQLKNIAIVTLFLAGVSPFQLIRFYQPNPGPQTRPSAQSDSLNPTALNESDSRKGLLTRFPLPAKSLKASFSVIVGILSFKPRAR